jgi:hypothetical protein
MPQLKKIGENRSRTDDIERRKHEIRQIEENKKETERVEKAKKNKKD